MTTLLLSLCLGFPAAQQPELAKLANWKFASKALTLTSEHKRALAKNGFFVSPGGNWHIYDVYGENDYDNLSSFVSVDNVIDLYHVFFDSTLRQIEERHLLPSARRMSETMLAASIRRLSKNRGGPLESAALKNVAYFAVAERLAGGKAAIPKAAVAMVTAEQAFIDKHAGFAHSAIFPYEADYSQFIVRGHYGHSAALGRYFKTMMWYGLMPVALQDRNGAPIPEQVRQTSMMIDDLYSTSAHKEWDRIYTLSSLYAGDANDLTPGDWRRATSKILPDPSGMDSLATSAGVARLVEAAKRVQHAAIVSKRVEGVRAGDLQFRFMGQRAIPDSVVFNHLTGDARPWPSPLDVGVVLGSKRAAAILDAHPETYNPMNWGGYREQRSKDATSWAAQPASYWRSNLYTGTLDVLRKVVASPAAKAPAFMRSAAWADRCLCVAMAGWAELRHDTILYGEQSVAEQGDGDEPKPPPPVKSYVEPNIVVYERLLELVKQTAAGLGKYGYLEEKQYHEVSVGHQLKAFEGLLSFFMSVSRRELGGGRLTAAEHMRLRKIEGDLSDLWDSIQLAGTKYDVLTQDDQDMAVIADVHTGGDQALEVGVGHADDLIVIVPIEGKKYIARGSALSFYEFRVPIGDRMTDHAWKALLEGGETKPRPPWTSTFFVNKTCRNAG